MTSASGRLATLPRYQKNNFLSSFGQRGPVPSSRVSGHWPRIDSMCSRRRRLSLVGIGTAVASPASWSPTREYWPGGEESPLARCWCNTVQVVSAKRNSCRLVAYCLGRFQPDCNFTCPLQLGGLVCQFVRAKRGRVSRGCIAVRGYAGIVPKSPARRREASMCRTVITASPTKSPFGPLCHVFDKGNRLLLGSGLILTLFEALSADSKLSLDSNDGGEDERCSDQLQVQL